MVTEQQSLITELGLTKEVVAKIACGNDPEKSVRTMAKYLLNQFASGAMILRRETVERIDKLVGKGVGEDDIVQLIGEALAGQGDEWVKARVDPINHESLKQLADMAGKTIPEFVQDYFEHSIAQGWMWDYTPTVDRNVSFTLDQKRDLEKLLGVTNLMGSDLYDFVMEGKPAEES